MIRRVKGGTLDHIGHRIRKAREEAELDLRQLAKVLEERCGVPVQYGHIGRMERGEAGPTKEMWVSDALGELARLLDVHPVWLLTSTGRIEWRRVREENARMLDIASWLEEVAADLREAYGADPDLRLED